MTVIAVDVRGKDIVIGADSQITQGWHMRIDKAAKLHTSPTGVTFALTGYAEMAALLRLYTHNHQPRESTEYGITQFYTEFRKWANEETDEPKLDGHFFLIYQGRAWSVADYYITEVTSFAAMGSGMEYAEAALYLGKSVKDAIKAACHLSITCHKPIRVEHFPKAKVT